MGGFFDFRNSRSKEKYSKSQFNDGATLHIILAIKNEMKSRGINNDLAQVIPEYLDIHSLFKENVKGLVEKIETLNLKSPNRRYVVELNCDQEDLVGNDFWHIGCIITVKDPRKSTFVVGNDGQKSHKTTHHVVLNDRLPQNKSDDCEKIKNHFIEKVL
eukprot:NODE_1450_length_1035_cov_0.219017.p1 type:complete len:159 gc:universal NODE_1450_length_1035_cov_0.219017:920-444(-)